MRWQVSLLLTASLCVVSAAKSAVAMTVRLPVTTIDLTLFALAVAASAAFLWSEMHRPISIRTAHSSRANRQVCAAHYANSKATPGESAGDACEPTERPPTLGARP